MKKVFLFACLFFPGCSTINQMNSNMQTSNALMSENITIMQKSGTIIQENTHEVQRSTAATKEMEETIKSNSSRMDQIVDEVKEHSRTIPLALSVLVFLLLLPSLLLLIFYVRVARFLKR